MRIVFFGNGEFGVPILRMLAEHHDVPAVMTNPDRLSGRGRKTHPTPVKKSANENDIPVIEAEKLRDPDLHNRLKDLDADLFFVVAYRILPPEIFTMPSLGTVNLHTSLLPDYRGAAPINWAIINGDTETGMTTFFIDENVDTGAMIMTERIAIDPDETAGELSARMSETGAGLSLRTVDAIERGEAVTMPQPDIQARPAPKLSKEDGIIDWHGSAQDIHNLVRGLDPWPGAYTTDTRGMLKIHRSALTHGEAGHEPGTVINADRANGLVVSCGEGALRLVEVQPEGKKAMDGASYVNGYRVKAGNRLGER